MDHRRFVPSAMRGQMKCGSNLPVPIPGGAWYEAHGSPDALEYCFEAGALRGKSWLSMDLFVEGARLVAFDLCLREGSGGPAFSLHFGVLGDCQARVRLPFTLLSLSLPPIGREGSFLRGAPGGDLVDLARVDRIELHVQRMSEEPLALLATPITVSDEEPERLEDPCLPKGQLLDELGQSRLRDWAEKTHSSEELIQRLEDSLDAAPAQRWPENFSRWGGWKSLRFEASGFFRRRFDSRTGRWWLVDPEGYAFWSSGLNCVRAQIETECRGLEEALSWTPESDGPFAAAREAESRINYLAANLIRAFGSEQTERWSAIAFSELRGLGFNTVANWSDWQAAKAVGFPYVRPLTFRWHRAPTVFRDMPDVYYPGFSEDCRMAAEALSETATDPALVGYFLGNEPRWGFAHQTVAEGMLYNYEAGPARSALADFVAARHETDEALSLAWGERVSFDDLKSGIWRRPAPAGAQRDLADFSAEMCDRLFQRMCRATRAVDRDHLNLGIRFHTIPPDWALGAMRVFDVFSFNCYKHRIASDALTRVSEQLHAPILIGEFHFGSLDVGLPGSGLARVENQAERGKAYRVYVEHAAQHSACVGAHYFTMYDQSALGRFDGEAFQIGFFDVAHRRYELLARAARETHERIYEVANGSCEPTNEEPEYLSPVWA
ncbi:MAG TPA: hypothetical protein VGJ84_08780 [Polyangiaceae bacterium]